MSGELDPVTPPVVGRGDRQAPLPNAKHIVVPGTGHRRGGTGCGMRIIRSFIDQRHDRRTRYQLHREREAAAVLPHAGGTRPGTARRAGADADDSRREPAQALRRGARRRRRVLHRRRRRGHRPARPERRRQDDDAAHALHADAAGRGHDSRRRRRRGRRSARRAAAARRAARSVGPLSAPDRARAHRLLRRAAGHHRRRPARAAPITC